MQNNWPSSGRFETDDLTDKDLDLMEIQYKGLTNIQEELEKKSPDKSKLKTLSKKYIKATENRIKANPKYMKKEIVEETGEGTAMYIGINASKKVGYKYDVMTFNKDNAPAILPFDAVVPLIKSRKMDKSTIPSEWIYHSGALLCNLMDELNVPNWKDKLNSQTKKQPVTLYSILKDYIE